MGTLVFLHTAAAHVQSFEALLRELSPATRARHLVREDLLERARRLGAGHPEVTDAVGAAVRAAAGADRVVLCTCSTIGGVAEAAGAQLDAAVLRVDRPMAEEAVRLGPRITVAAALASTLDPTRELIRDVAARRGARIELGTLLVDDAWACFERGDLDGYHERIADALRSQRDSDVVVLAQASMAGALEHLHGFAVPVLASPLLGVRAAVARLRLGPRAP